MFNADSECILWIHNVSAFSEQLLWNACRTCIVSLSNTSFRVNMIKLKIKQILYVASVGSLHSFFFFFFILASRRHKELILGLKWGRFVQPFKEQKWCSSLGALNFGVNSECFLNYSEFGAKLKIMESLRTLIVKAYCECIL